MLQPGQTRRHRAGQALPPRRLGRCALSESDHSDHCDGGEDQDDGGGGDQDDLNHNHYHFHLPQGRTS